MIQKYGLVPGNYPKMMWELEKNYLNYYMKEYPLYAIELKFKDVPRYLSYFVVRMFSQNPVWAESLLKKYNLYDNLVFRWEGCDREVR